MRTQRVDHANCASTVRVEQRPDLALPLDELGAERTSVDEIYASISSKQLAIMERERARIANDGRTAARLEMLCELAVLVSRFLGLPIGNRDRHVTIAAPLPIATEKCVQ